MATVSVIIPCYNSEKHIEKCIESLANQTFKDFDIYIIDDFSKDDSIKKIENCVNKYDLAIHLLINESNMGPSLARKRGIEDAASKYIAFCDSDDTYEPTFLKKMVGMLEEGNDVVFCNYNIVTKNRLRKRKWLKSKCFDNNTLIAEGPDSLCCIMVCSFLINKIEFPDIRNGEDMAMVPVILSKAQKIGYVNECLYNYIYRDCSLSSRVDDSVVDSLKKSYDYIYKALHERYYEECVYLGVRNYLYGSLLNLFKFRPPCYKSIARIIDEFNHINKNWEKNKYMKELPIYKIVFLRAASKKMFLLCTLIARIHNLFL